MTIKQSSAQRLRTAPPALQELLQAISLIPPTQELEDFDGAIPAGLEKEFNRGSETACIQIHSEIVTCLERLPKKFSFYLWSLGFRKALTSNNQKAFDLAGIWKTCTDARLDGWFIDYFQQGPKRRTLQEYRDATNDPFLGKWVYMSVIHQIRLEYEFIRAARVSLRKISEFSGLENASLRTSLFNLHARIQVQAELIIGSDGTLEVENPFIKVIRGVDGRRIRKCEACARLFWAGRLDAVCCSGPCANARRTRLYRERRNRGFYQGARPTKNEEAELSAAHQSGRKGK